MNARFRSTATAIAYLTAGNAIATIVSGETGRRFTYQLRRSTDGAVCFVAVLTGENNASDYEFVGVVRGSEFRHSLKSRISSDATSVKAFAWVWRMLHSGEAIRSVEIWHNGHCARCGRLLTDPTSIETGLGPVCREKWV